MSTFMYDIACVHAMALPWLHDILRQGISMLKDRTVPVAHICVMINSSMHVHLAKHRIDDGSYNLAGPYM